MTNIASARKLENFPDRATINRVTSEQAIRRSKSLVKMTAELIARKQAPEPRAQSLTVALRPFQSPERMLAGSARIPGKHSRDRKQPATGTSHSATGPQPKAQQHNHRKATPPSASQARRPRNLMP